MARRRGKKKRRGGGGFRKGRKSRGGGRRGRRGRVRRQQMGLLGKAGVIVAGGVPVGWAAIEALPPWMDPAWAPATIPQKLKGSLALFTNNLVYGFGIPQPFSSTSVAFPAAALPVGTSVLASVNQAGFASTTAAGLGLVLTDVIVGALFKITGRARAARSKVMGKQMISG